MNVTPFCDASFDPLQQKTMKEELNAILTIGTRNVVSANKSAIGFKKV